MILVLLPMVAACQVGGGTASPPPTTVEVAPGSTSAEPPTTTTSPTTTAIAPTSPPPAPTTQTTTPTTQTTTLTTLPPGVTEPPEWLGARPLPEDENGDPLPQSTPPELVDRRFTTSDHLPAPPDGSFTSTVGEVPPEVAARSTWSEECPVPLDELAYVTVTFLGFDEIPHTGELLANAAVADDLVVAFGRLYAADYPIEEMRITAPADLDADPTGDGNPTTAFVCRPVTGGTGWSEHAYGLAVDINPFHNPYIRGDTILPELAGAYADRDRDLPGMIQEGDAVTRAFGDIGWAWGGRWSSLKDYQHFSLRGR